MQKGRKKCSRCKEVKTHSAFAKSTRNGHQSYCRACQRAYYESYITPSLRGRGAERTLPAWAQRLLEPRKVIWLFDHTPTTTTKPIKKVSHG